MENFSFWGLNCALLSFPYIDVFFYTNVYTCIVWTATEFQRKKYREWYTQKQSLGIKIIDIYLAKAFLAAVFLSCF